MTYIILYILLLRDIILYILLLIVISYALLLLREISYFIYHTIDTDVMLYTLISEMPYFRIIALRFMAVKFYHYLAIVWRISIQLGELWCVRVWGVPWRTHNNMLTHLAGMIDPELWFAKRYIKFVSMCMKSDNNTAKLFLWWVWMDCILF